MQASCWGLVSKLDKYLETFYILQMMFVPCALVVALKWNYTTKIVFPCCLETLIGAWRSSDLFSSLPHEHLANANAHRVFQAERQYGYLKYRFIFKLKWNETEALHLWSMLCSHWLLSARVILVLLFSS